MTRYAVKVDPWNKCDFCGRFIPYDDFASGAAQRWLITPDSEFSREEFGTLCKFHRKEPAAIEPIEDSET